MSGRDQASKSQAGALLDASSSTGHGNTGLAHGQSAGQVGLVNRADAGKSQWRRVRSFSTRSRFKRQNSRNHSARPAATDDAGMDIPCRPLFRALCLGVALLHASSRRRPCSVNQPPCNTLASCSRAWILIRSSWFGLGGLLFFWFFLSGLYYFRSSTCQSFFFFPSSSHAVLIHLFFGDSPSLQHIPTQIKSIDSVFSLTRDKAL